MSSKPTVHFSCNGCGGCCVGHHVPLTLQEAIRWVTDNGQIIILTEAFHRDGYGIPDPQFQHAAGRALLVRSGYTQIYLTATFAAFNPGRCRYLREDNSCGQYENRPLVCRIYPAEINPHIALNTKLKDCPSEVWEGAQPLIYRDGHLEPVTAGLVEESKRADREDAPTKAWICQQLGISHTALKGDGFMAWLPEVAAMQELLSNLPDAQCVNTDWSFTVSTASIARQLTMLGAQANLAAVGSTGIFIPLQSDQPAL